jgi:hypothetical protein
MKDTTPVRCDECGGSGVTASRLETCGVCDGRCTVPRWVADVNKRHKPRRSLWPLLWLVPVCLLTVAQFVYELLPNWVVLVLGVAYPVGYLSGYLGRLAWVAVWRRLAGRRVL